MQPLISIVMPVYKVAGYLEKAVRSVMGQSERDWELILVDDASPDECGEMCDAFAAEDARISVVHLMENGGLSNARNAGIKTARGRFLMFLDSDDWVEETLIKSLAEIVKREDPPQLTVWGVTEEHYGADGKLMETRRLSCPDEYLTDAEAVREAALRLERQTLLGYAWNKLYDMELIRESGVQFEKIPLIEDILFNLNILGGVHRMRIMNSTPYHYARRTAGSLTHSFLPYYYELNMRRVETMLGLYREWGLEEQAAGVLAPIYARYALSALQRNCDPQAGMTHSARRAFVKEMFASPLYGNIAPYLKKRSGLGALPGKVIAMKSPSLCLAAGRAVYIISTRMQGLFVKLIGERQGGEEK